MQCIRLRVASSMGGETGEPGAETPHLGFICFAGPASSSIRWLDHLYYSWSNRCRDQIVCLPGRAGILSNKVDLDSIIHRTSYSSAAFNLGLKLIWVERNLEASSAPTKPSVRFCFRWKSQHFISLILVLCPSISSAVRVSLWFIYPKCITPSAQREYSPGEFQFGLRTWAAAFSAFLLLLLLLTEAKLTFWKEWAENLD